MNENDYTVMCLSIGTPKIKKNPFVPNGKFVIFRCPKIWAHYSLIIMCLNIETPNNQDFPFWTNGKVVVLEVPILKHFRGTVFKIKQNSLLDRKCCKSFRHMNIHILFTTTFR